MQWKQKLISYHSQFTVDENRHHCLLGKTQNALTDWRVSLTKTAEQIFILFDVTRHFKKHCFER